jgi:hypothetical protein
MTATTPKRSLGKFYLVMLIFVIPMFASFGLYFFRDHMTFKMTNHGNFISPALPGDYLYAAKSEQHVWRIVHIDNGSCDKECSQIDFQLNQLRKVLGKDQNRLEVLSLHANQPAVSQLQNAIDQKSALKLSVTNKIYLLDPLGNIFMYYPDTVKPMDILKDLKRVLEVSQIG